MKECFNKKEYITMYIMRFAYEFANSLIQIFGAVILYKNGLKIPTILLIYALRFGIMGMLTPLCIKVSSKMGVAFCALTANIFRIISAYILLFHSSINIALFIIVMGIPGALGNPIGNALSSKYIPKEIRGKYNSIRGILQVLGMASASAVIAFGITNNNSILAFKLIIIFFLIDYLCVQFIDYTPKTEHKGIFKKSFKYVLKNKSNLKTISSIKAFHIIERTFVPLYLYMILEDFVLFSTVIIVSILIESIPIFITGILTDKSIKKTNNIVSVLKMLISAIFIFFKNKIIISINNTLYGVLEKVYTANFNTILHNGMTESKEEDVFISSISEMWLCFAELIALLLMAAISMYLGKQIFIVMFVCSIIATFIINRSKFAKTNDK